MVDREELSQICLLKFLARSHCFCMTQQTFVHQTFTLFLFPMSCFPSLWSPRPLSLLLASGCHVYLILPDCLWKLTIYTDALCIYNVIKFDFLLNLSHVNLIPTSAGRIVKDRENNFPSQWGPLTNIKIQVIGMV